MHKNMRIRNAKNEKLFLVVRSSSKEIRPYISSACTWEEAVEKFNKFTEEVDDKEYFRTIVKKDVREDLDAVASCIENHKGWGYDYMIYVEIRPLHE